MSIRYLWTRALLVGALLAVLTVVLVLAVGERVALLVLIGLLVAMLWFHLRNLDALIRWTREPVGTPVPRSVGVWARAYGELSRRSRLAYDLRERLSVALERFREASQAMPDGVMYLSERGVIEWLNQRAELHFGLNAATDIGVPVINIVRQPEFISFLGARGVPEPLVMPSLRNPGLILLVQIIPFGDGQRMVVSRDISQIERLENMRRDFVANVSHEIRTPLTVVSGFLEMLRDQWSTLDDEEIARFLRLAHEQSERMQALIADLLTLSALETHAPAPDEESSDLAALLSEVRAQAEALSNGRHAISVRMDDKVPDVLGARRELLSAFSNLAVNAVRYTPDGGSIELGWVSLPDGRGEFYVRDSGIGIAPEHLNRLTERFYRIDKGRSRETGGTGLGLAIVKHILNRHQAELLIDSEPGRGSRFAVRLPAQRLAALRSQLREAEAASDALYSKVH